MIFVAVGDQHRLDRALPLAEVGDVRNDDVDAERGLIRKGESTVNQDDRLLILIEIEVLSDLAHPAERNQAEWWSARSRSIRASTDWGALPCGTRGGCGTRLRSPLAPPATLSWAPTLTLTLRACRWTLTTLIH